MRLFEFYGFDGVPKFTRQVARRKVDSELFVVFKFPRNEKKTYEEVKVWVHIAHDNLIQIISFHEDKENFYVVSEFCDGGSLNAAIKHQQLENKQFGESQLKEWIAQIVDGVKFLHRIGIVHGDITAKHAYLTYSRRHVKLTVLRDELLSRSRYRKEKVVETDDLVAIGMLSLRLAILKTEEEEVDMEKSLSEFAKKRLEILFKYSWALVDFMSATRTAKNIEVVVDHAWLITPITHLDTLLELVKKEEDSIKKRLTSLHKAPVLWGYNDKGPYAWSKRYPLLTSDNQSPIEIDTTADYVIYDASLSPITINYKHCTSTLLYNDGHAFKVTFDVDQPAIVSGGPLGSKQYQLVQYHAHWASHDECHGSEHIVDNEEYVAEFHFVHFNKAYETFVNALAYQDGLAVIGIFVKLDKNAASGKAATCFQEIAEDLGLIRWKGHDVHLMKNHNPYDLIPTTSLDRYWTYKGSLTAPPLSECVTWLILAEPITLTPAQLGACRSLRRLNNYEKVNFNKRAVLPRNDRCVYTSFIKSQ